MKNINYLEHWDTHQNKTSTELHNNVNVPNTTELYI